MTLCTRNARRSLLLLALSPAAAALSCARRSPAAGPRRRRVPLASIPEGGRLRIEYDGEPAEIVRGPDGLVARNMSCTHFGCVVRWNEAEGRYRCACHDGAYDADGRPIAGPPTRPLKLIPVTVEGSDAVLGP